MKEVVNRIFLDTCNTPERRLKLDQRIVAATNIPTDARVLDTSCGTGELVKVLSQAVQHTPTGIDLSAESILTCKKNIKGNFLVASAEATPFPNDAFDVLFSLFTLHHLGNVTKVVNEWDRILTNTGTVYLADYFPAGAVHTQLVNAWGCPETYYFNKFYSPDQFLDVLSETNFKVEQTQDISWSPFGRLLLFTLTH